MLKDVIWRNGTHRKKGSTMPWSYIATRYKCLQRLQKEMYKLQSFQNPDFNSTGIVMILILLKICYTFTKNAITCFIHFRFQKSMDFFLSLGKGSESPSLPQFFPQKRWMLHPTPWPRIRGAPSILICFLAQKETRIFWGMDGEFMIACDEFCWVYHSLCGFIFHKGWSSHD